MVRYTLFLGMVYLSVVVSTPAGVYQPGGRQVGFRDDKCSAMDAILPDPESGCCGRHAETSGNDGSDDGDDAERLDDSDDGDEPDDGVDYGPGGDGDLEDENPNFGNWDVNWNNGISWHLKRSTDQNVSDVVPDKYITAGKPAGILQYPWLVHLTVKLMDKMIGCGGSLISCRHVLTAAHCVDYQIRNYNDVSIYIAEYNTSTYPKDCVGKHCVMNMIVHPNKISKHKGYRRERLHNDIAMMRLKGSAPYTDYIRPICLPPFNLNTGKHEGTPLTITGWGQTEHGQLSSVKLHTQVLQVAPSICRRYYPDISKGHLCAAGKGGQDTCLGDSGGPIMVERDGTFYLVGLVSGKRSGAGCGSPVPTLYTNVFAYRKWIQNFMRN